MEFSVKDSFANHNPVDYITTVHPALNKSDCANKSKEIKAKPLELKPSIIDFLKNDVVGFQ